MRSGMRASEPHVVLNLETAVDRRLSDRGHEVIGWNGC
jgi:hypothetical protein